jgi:hypothetical protein
MGANENGLVFPKQCTNDLILLEENNSPGLRKGMGIYTQVIKFPGGVHLW